MMRRLVSYLGGAAVLALGIFMLLYQHGTSALSGADWKAGNIISDAIFTDASSMSAQQVQNFLDAQIGARGGCDTWGTRNASDWGRPDITRAQYAALKGWPAPPYVCLNQYYEAPKTTPGPGIPDNSYNHYNAETKTLLAVPGGISAAQMIYNAAQQYQINPEVLLVKIQTESAGPLTQDAWPLPNQYTYAMGSNCPDSGPNHSANCDPNYAGFSMQIYSAAALLRSYLTNMNQPWWSHYKVGSNSILYNPDQNCGSSTVNIQGMATAALYTYTPYQPNNAALNAMNNTSAGSPGGTTVPCGAYGNRNFWWWFNHWFGSSIILPEVNSRYEALANAGQSLGSVIDDGFCVDAAHTTCWQGFQNGYIVYNKNTGAWESLGSIRVRWSILGYQNGQMGFPTGPVICGTIKDNGCYQEYQNGYIVGTGPTGYWESLGDIRTRWFQLSYQDGALGYPTGSIYRLANGGYFQQYQNGYIVGSSATGWWESMNGPIRDRWAALRFQDGRLGYPTSAPDCGQPSSGCMQRFQGGTVYWTSGTGAWPVWGEIANRYNQLDANNGSLGYPTDAEVCGTIWGNGCYQQYQNGYIVGSSATGWWESLGQIRARWSALRFQDGALGYPTSSQDCTLPDGGCKQRFQGGSIYWTQGTGAWQVWGGIGSRYNQLDAASGSLGYPVSAEVCGTIWGNGCYQQYQNGYIVGSPATGWWESLGAIRTKWSQLYFQDGALGYPTSGQDCTLPDSGCKQRFQGGAIYWTQGTGAWQVWGGIGSRYNQLGTVTSSLGYPTNTEVCGTIKNNGCYQQYQNGYIVGSSATGWWESLGQIRARWSALSSQDGALGYPLGPQTCGIKNNGCYQKYQNGYIVGTDTTGYWESSGSIRDKWASLGYETSPLGYPTSAISCATGTCSQTYEHGTITSDSSGTRHTLN